MSDEGVSLHLAHQLLYLYLVQGSRYKVYSDRYKVHTRQKALVHGTRVDVDFVPSAAQLKYQYEV